MKRPTLAFALGALCIASVQAADSSTIDWSKVPVATVALFYPGVSSYEWLRSPAHKGAGKVTSGAACAGCHDEANVEKAMGEKIVKGGPLEPTPVSGKMGYIDLNVQAAYDDRNAYLRFQWKTAKPFAGTEHQHLMFDGKEWKVHGFPRLDKVVREGAQPGIYEDRMSVMLDDGKVPGFAQQGCWLTCHDGQRDMPRLATKDEVAANPLLAAIKKNDVRKYLPESRSDPKDWKTGKPIDELAKIKAAGGFVDLIQWRGHRSNAVGMADDGYVLEWRNSDAGKSMFASNADPKTHQPRFMWDEKKVGYKSITVDEIGRAKTPFLIRELNAVPFDPNAGWKAGDMVPDYVVSREDATGSAADVNATSDWKGGVWTVVMIRPLGSTHPDDKALKEGNVYSVGFAVHDDSITTRGHHVSFVRTLGFGANTKADIKAVKLP